MPNFNEIDRESWRKHLCPNCHDYVGEGLHVCQVRWISAETAKSQEDAAHTQGVKDERERIIKILHPLKLEKPCECCGGSIKGHWQGLNFSPPTPRQ